MSRPLARTAEVMIPDEGSVAFTGRLACMSRAEAFEVVRQKGGTPSQAVTKLTSLLIVGELGRPLSDDGRPSNKLARATSYVRVSTFKQGKSGLGLRRSGRRLSGSQRRRASS